MPETRTATPSPTDPLAAFRARLESGRFNAVLGRALRRTMRDAAADPGLDAEVGALRLALARLLTEERDSTRLAAGVARLTAVAARLTAVAVQAARLRQPPGSDLDEIQAILKRELDAIDAELAAEQSASPFAIADGGWCGPASPMLDAKSPSPTAVGRVPSGRRLG